MNVTHDEAMHDTARPGWIGLREAHALLLAEAEAERAVADPNLPDPCAWVNEGPDFVRLLATRMRDPLPVADRGGGRGRVMRFDPAAVREWFAEEFERRNIGCAPEALTISDATGILLTASVLARELGIHPQTLARRLRDYRVQPARMTPGATWYRLADMLRALTAAAKAEDPNSLPPQDRDAHWRAESREDEVRKNRRELIPVSECISLMNTLAGALRDFYDLIPDTLEGKCGLAPEALAIIERELDDARRANAQRLREIQAQLTATANATAANAEQPAEFDLEAT